MRRVIPLLLLVLALLRVERSAQAAVPLCVTVESSDSGDDLDRLVRDELGHHPSHQLVAEGCPSTLRVELLRVAGLRYLTARIEGQVPMRYAIKSAAEIPERLSEALRLVLGHDPVYLLEDTSRYNAVQRTALNLLKRGTTRYRFSIFETLAGTGRNPAFATGGSFELSRGIDHVQVFLRMHGAGASGDASTDTRLMRFLAGLDLGFLYETSARGNATFYLGPGLGLLAMQVRGFVDGMEGRGAESALKLDGAFSGRVGLRFLRQHNFDLDVFAIGYLPLTNAQDVDSVLPRAYTPSLQLGMGVGF